MNENPFAHSAELVPQPQQRFGIGSRVMWFTFGFVGCFGLCSTFFLFVSYRNYQTLGPHDYSRIWPADSPDKPEWLEHAKFRTVNGFAIVVADDVKNASAMVWPVSGAGQMTVYDDSDHDGRADWLRLLDRKGRSFQFKIADGAFRSYDFTPDVVQFEGGSTFYDYDFDGDFDCKVITGNKTTFWLMVDSQWCQLTPEGDSKGRVDVNGEWRRAVYVDDQWRLERPLNPEP